MRLIIGNTLFALSLLVAILNFYLSFIRGSVRKPVDARNRHVSGIPVLGTLLLIGALVCLEHSPLVYALAVLSVLLDTGGLGWFLFMMLWMQFHHNRNGDVKGP
jgi:hypothetical protein